MTSQLTLWEEDMSVRTEKQPRLFPLMEPEQCRLPQNVRTEVASLLAQLIENLWDVRNKGHRERGDHE